MNHTPAQRLKARELFKNMVSHKAKADHLALELLSHPDATAIHLASAHRVSIVAREALEHSTTTLRVAFPSRSLMRDEQWHNHEYDRYNRPSLLKAKETT
jgi:hypothetical protein